MRGYGIVTAGQLKSSRRLSCQVHTCVALATSRHGGLIICITREKLEVMAYRGAPYLLLAGGSQGSGPLRTHGLRLLCPREGTPRHGFWLPVHVFYNPKP